jgi:L-histidine Nalpha-methyltransferase
LNSPVHTPPLPAAAPRVPRFTQIYREDHDATKAELLCGLSAAAAVTSPKFLYDALGSRLFEAITELPEYYPTRTEAAIFKTHGPAMAQAIGPIGSFIDLGAGNCGKALSLFPVLQPQRYVAVDISVDFLRGALAQVQREHPQLDVSGVGLDFSSRLHMPPGSVQGRPVYFYAGSSIGNFTPEEAVPFLTSVREQAGGGGLLIGVDLVKASEVLEPAYDDALGVTAAFNLNLLLHLNRLIGANFQPREWRHIGLFDRAQSRIEMHLEARHALTVAWPGGERRFEAGERIHTENSCKYTVPGFEALLEKSGFGRGRHWLDERGWFAVFWAPA